MWGLKRWQDCRCSGAATVLIRPWGHSHTQNGVFKGRDRAGWDTLMHAQVYITHAYTCFSIITHSCSFSSWTHTPTRTLAYSRCRTQRNTLGVTVEREGHWEMFLATCRASILRAASTNSSWAAHTVGEVRVGGDWWISRVRKEGCGPRMREQRENIETWVEHTCCCLYYISHLQWA